IAVNYPTPIAQNGCNPVVTSNPPSGSLFTIGTTVVTVTAQDSANRTTTCSFNITVQPAGTPIPPNQNIPPSPIPMPGPGSGGGVCGMGTVTMAPMMLFGLGWVRRRSRRRSPLV
ncbi:MAG: HYR domain-containing protein, partial [Phycisphaerae bacterium]